MPVIKVFPQDVDRKLTEVFTRFGYDGASMELLSQATGLKKASLYHRFPGGKKEMAQHVLLNIRTWFLERIDAVIRDPSLPLEARLAEALKAIRDLFEDGDRNCPLRMLSAGSESAFFQEAIAACFTILSDGFSHIAMENGLPENVAKAKAMEAMINIQGSLILSRALKDNTIFGTSISAIPKLLGQRN
ncbi:TetR/AcrR family transcriptional regulator [Dyadobacter sp. LHD-138]|uniref:TetR/AcrR family transcriptional regulator n=1 Tax=Dyadobacter sp. LHD-138 TaxID=3071413 RepID=UPI0027E01243|nr:TetR/AcrR family transcriptional regulator [Dyadobacter sp. LHD-138]MDQ6479893.1 TetR/AcrR family transcriptional regulator [Dyadobacter sp. LHD-138]